MKGTLLITEKGHLREWKRDAYGKGKGAFELINEGNRERWKKGTENKEKEKKRGKRIR